MKTKLSKKVLSVFLCFALIMTYLPLSVKASAATINDTVITDPGTADAWEDIMGTAADGSRYAGRVWVDKSVYKDGDTVKLNRQGNSESTFTVDVDEANGEYFQVVFSALGSSMSTDTKTYANRPLDVVLILDTSTSMDDVSSDRKTRFQHMIEAANVLLEDLLALGDVRVAIVSFNADSETIIELKKYNNGIKLSVNSYSSGSGNGVITARDNDEAYLGSDSGYTAGTNLQDGIDRGMNILATAENAEGRAPVAIVLADGRANRAVDKQWYAPVSSNIGKSSDDSAIMLSTLLNAAYGRTRVEKNYGTEMTVYGIGIDLSSSSDDYIYLNPGAEGSSGFNASNTNGSVIDAWNAFTLWRSGTTAELEFGSGKNSRTWTFDHAWPTSAGVTTAEIAANINYVDNYQDVSGAKLGDAFENILQELSTGAFNPITDTKNGATGVEDTPLIYVDNIGQYMQIKNIQAVQVFGTTYNVTKNADGTYSVAAGSGFNPTTNESWNTQNDIHINVNQNADGTQQLRVYINQEILPILLDEISVTTTENGVTTTTLEEHTYAPLRIYYTVGIDDDILLSNGEVNPVKLDSNYAYLNDDGTASFYSNAFGVMNTTDTDGDAFVDIGDAHVGFVPSHENRYYYHQTHREIFVDAKNIDGSDIVWDDDMYGVPWEAGKYNLTAMTYADIAAVQDTDRVYTYVTFIRPTGNGIEAEEVTYLVYTTWGDLKSAVTFHDKVNSINLNNGEAIDVDQVNTVVSNYLNSNSGVKDDDLIAILGMQSRRVSRLHNIFETKTDNATGTAETSFAPEYNDSAHEDGDIHEASEVIVWLGNNGKLTLPVASGIKITKDVTKLADGASADEKFPITVTIDGAFYGLVVTNANGEELPVDVPTVSSGKTTVKLELADGESAIILGVTGGTDFTVTEDAHKKYTGTYAGATQTKTGEIVEGVVTNSPILPGGLYITKEVEHAFGGEVFPTDQEFLFEVTFKDAEGNAIANTNFTFENKYDEALTELATDENGVVTVKLRHGETVYIRDIPAGATVTVKEIDEANDKYTIKSYRSRNFSGDTADNDSTVTITSGANATVVVINTYTPDQVGVDISFSGTKNFDATEMNADSEFTFKLQEYKNGQWTDVDDKTVTVVKGENASKTFAFAPLNLEFDEPGVHSYQIIEVKGDNTNITYDRSVYTFSVNVVIDSNGDLQAEVIGHNEKENIFDVSGDSASGYVVDTVFTNYYHKTATSIKINKTVEDKANSGKTPAGFVIETYEATVDTNNNWIIGDLIGSTITDAQGEALLNHNYDNTDFEGVTGNTVNYHYIIKEKDTDIAGWTYDATEYRVTVVLTKAADETISADFNIVKVTADGQKTDLNVSGDKATINFANTYSPESAKVNLNVTPTVLKNLDGRDLKAGEFTFAIFKNGEAVFDADGRLTNIEDAIATGTNDADGNVIFAPVSLSFTQVGKYEYDVIEVKGSLGGVIYDPTIYDLVVEVSDAGNGKLQAEHYFEDSVTKQVTFKNTYNVEPIEITINGIKTLQVNNGTKTLRAGEYTFGLYNEAGTKIDETTNLADGTFAFGAIEYGIDDIGRTYTYTVKEIAPNGTTDGSYSAGGVTWSAQSFTVTVKITDNGNGTITANVTGNGSDNIKFINQYNSNPVSVVLDGKKILEGRPLAAGEFTFTLYSTDRNFENLTPVNENITHDIDGAFSVDLGTLGQGRHYFLLKENIPAEHAKGIHYSVAEFHITIFVTDNGSGQMTYTKTVVNPGVPGVTDAAIEFTNVYSPEPGEIPLSGSKIYNGGKALEDGVFSVDLYDSEAELLQTAPIKADGSFVFENLKYQAADVGNTYTYTIKERIPDGATDNGDGTFTFGNNIYDGSIYTLTVSITDDDKDGVLEINSVLTKDTAAVSDITFTNTFVPDPITYSIAAKKTYEKGLKGDDFEFTLVSADDKTNVNQSKKNDANGDIKFDAITFSEAGSYKFTVKEIGKILGFIRYSAAEYDVTITVVNENGVLRVSDVNIVNTENTGEANLEFINVYVMDGEDEITLRGTKKLTGDRAQVNADEFEFGLYDAAGELVESVKNDENGNFVFTTLKFDETDVPVSGQKQITYTVKEIKGTDIRVTYDETVYTVVVTVKDNEQGGVTASYTVNGDAEGLITFTNIYTSKPEDITVDIDIIKTVVNKGSEEISPEGFEFLLKALSDGAADITVKADENGKAKFTLTFTEDDIGKTYTYQLTEVNDGKANVTYSVAEYTVTVEIELNENNKLVATLTKNGENVTAVIAEFENIYDYTPTPDPDPENPKTDDNTNLDLWVALLFISGGGIIGTTLYGRKRRTEEN